MPTFLSNEAIDNYYRGMKEPVNAEITQAGSDYQAALNRLQQMKEQQDAENYRSYARQQAELPGLMRASGNNGGMVDSAVASLANAYNQARAKRALEYENNRANQDLDYNNRLAELNAKLTQYDQLAAADKANLLAEQEAAAAAAAAAARARSYSSGGSGGSYSGGSSSSAPASKTTSSQFYDDYLDRSGQTTQKEAQKTINLYNAGVIKDPHEFNTAVMNKISPRDGYPKSNNVTTQKDTVNNFIKGQLAADKFLLWNP